MTRVTKTDGRILTGSRDNEKPRDDTRLPNTAKTRQIAPVGPRLSLGQIGNQCFNLASPRVRLVNVTRYKSLRRRTRPFSEVGNGQKFGIGHLIENHGQQVRVAWQRSSRAFLRLNGREALKRLGGQA